MKFNKLKIIKKIPILPLFTIPLRIAVCAILFAFVSPFALIYLMFSPKEAWGDVKFFLLDAKYFVIEGTNDSILSDEDDE